MKKTKKISELTKDELLGLIYHHLPNTYYKVHPIVCVCGVACDIVGNPDELVDVEGHLVKPYGIICDKCEDQMISWNDLRFEDQKKIFEAGANWLNEHKEHVKKLANSHDGHAYYPCGSDLYRPELWKPGHWKWFLELMEKQFINKSELDDHMIGV